MVKVCWLSGLFEKASMMGKYLVTIRIMKTHPVFKIIFPLAGILFL